MASLLPSLRRNPQQSEKPLARLRDELDTLFERLLSPWSESSSESEYGLDRLGNLEVDDRDNEIVVRAETPGFDPKEIDVEVNGRLLTIKAEKKQEKKRKKGDDDVEEQEYRVFVESVALPEGVERDKIEAKYHHGVLEVHLPKSEKAKPKRISVQS